MTLNNMKNFGGNFGTRSDGIYGVLKMWCVYPNMETRNKRKIVHGYHYLRKIELKSPQLRTSMFQIWKCDFRGYWGHVTMLAWKNIKI